MDAQLLERICAFWQKRRFVHPRGERPWFSYSGAHFSPRRICPQQAESDKFSVDAKASDKGFLDNIMTELKEACA
jgi:hypothetical protein